MSATVAPTTPPQVLQTDRRFFDLFPDEHEDAAIVLAETLAVQPDLTTGGAGAAATSALRDAAAPLDAVGWCRLIEAVAARDMPAAIAVAIARIHPKAEAVFAGRLGLCAGAAAAPVLWLRTDPGEARTAQRLAGNVAPLDTLFPIDGIGPAPMLQAHGDALPADVARTAAAWLAIAGSALALGAMQRTVDHVMQYARRRKAFGEPIIKHQAVGMRLADLVIALDGLRLCLVQFASDHTLGRNDATTFDILHRQLDDTQCAVSGDALRVMGGHGYLASAPTAQLARVLPRLAMLVAEAGAFPHAFPGGDTGPFPRKASA